MGTSEVLASGEIVPAGAVAATSAGGASRTTGWASATRPFEAQPCDTTAAAKVRPPSVTVTAGISRPKRFGSPITLVILVGPHLQLRPSPYSTTRPRKNSGKSMTRVAGQGMPARKSFELARAEERAARAGVRAATAG